MSDFRGHSPLVIEEFNGLWRRGDADSTPPDHFSDCNNVSYIESGFKWRDGIEHYFSIPNVKRQYTYTKQTGQSQLVLDGNGDIWDTDYYPAGPVLSIATMTDFGFLAYAGRAYISPCDGNTGLQNEFIYVYLGDGTAARKAAGDKPTDADGALAAANSASAGNVEAGIHVFAAVYETNTGFLTAIGPDTLPTVTAPGSFSVDLSNIPVSPNAYVTNVHIIATKAINPTFYTGDTRGYQFFFVPGAVVTNGTTTLTVSFFDVELLEDASYLLDMFEEIPAGAGLGQYHNRLVSWAEFDNESLIRISVAGEPEAINQVDGLVIFPLDGNPVTQVQEFRDVMYGFKKTKTNGWSDNGDVPSSWQMTVLDQGIGTFLHGVGKVLDSEGVNIDYLIIASLGGMFLFNGSYARPELTFKIRDYWIETLDQSALNKIHMISNPTSQVLYAVLQDGSVLVGDYSNGMDYKSIRWTKWTFDQFITTVSMINTNDVLFGAQST